MKYFIILLLFSSCSASVIRFPYQEGEPVERVLSPNDYRTAKRTRLDQPKLRAYLSNDSQQRALVLWEFRNTGDSKEEKPFIRGKEN
jgi:hypothetical protein